MKKKFCTITMLCIMCCKAFAQTETTQTDSLQIERLQEVNVIAIGNNFAKNYSAAISRIDNNYYQMSEFSRGRDIPTLLEILPSAVYTSDAGNGIGYTGIRIRGVDATRINVTINGVPMNDGESHSVYWVNAPDLSSSLNHITIENGVGSSKNGAGAFGASVMMETQRLQKNPYTNISLSGGSYNTHRQNINIGSGLINNHWAFNARLSNIKSDGYIDRASADLKSYHAEGAYYGNRNRTSIKFLTFGGTQKTYHAWDGIDKDQMDENRRYNPCGEIQDDAGNVVGFYKNQIDKYTQRNYQLIFNQILNDYWSMNFTFHYTKGDGYYEEYKNARTLVEYGLQPFTVDGVTTKKANLIRQKHMTNGFGGGIFSANYKRNEFSVSLYAAANKYDGDHWGNVIWIKNYIGNLEPNHEYYFNSSKKIDMNFFAKANYEIIDNLNVYADLQFRRITHKIDGANDSWDWINSTMQALTIDNSYNFFNPKVGAYYRFNAQNTVYASFAVAGKEPTRNQFTDAKFNTTPKSEKLFDYELGYNYNNSGKYSAGINFYYMNYKNQLVLTGETNDIGETLSDNVPKSYRAGVEISGTAQIFDWLQWNINAAFSSSKIKNHTEYVDDYDESWNALYTQSANYVGTTAISYSPNTVASSIFIAKYKDFTFNFISKYVSKQYVTNSQQSDLQLDAYFVNNIAVEYSWKPKFCKEIIFGFDVNNIFNTKYCSNGWGGSSFIKNSSGNIVNRSNYMGYYPQATANFLANLTFKF